MCSKPSIYIIKRVMSLCLLPMAGRTAGPIKTKLGIGTHVDPGSVLVKVKVIYLCVRYNRIHDSDTWRTTMNHARSSSSSNAVAGATWWMLIKLLTSAGHRLAPSGGRVLWDSVYILIYTPSLGVYYFLSLTLSVCTSVCLSQTLLLLFCFSMESSHFLAISFPWQKLQNVVLRFLMLGP